MMVVIKYSLGVVLVVAALIAYGRRDAVIDAYRWGPTVTRPTPTPFDATAVAEAARLALPADNLGTLARPDIASTPLPVVVATTLPAPAVLGGTAVVTGAVIGPDGNGVAGATVRLERLVGDATATLDVTTSASGTFLVDRLLGGRYRVRAWRAPNLTQEGSEVAFVADGDRRSLTLGLAAPSRLDLTATASPSPLAVGQTTTLVVRALVDVVAADGRIDKVGRPGLPITAVGTGPFSGQTGQGTSDAAGSVVFTFRCAQAGPATVTVGNAAARQTVTVDCLVAATTTTGPATPGPAPTTSPTPAGGR
jgi:hypothetical protein